MAKYRGLQMKGNTYQLKEESRANYYNSKEAKVIRVYDAHTVLVENENGKVFMMAKHNLILNQVQDGPVKRTFQEWLKIFLEEKGLTGYKLYRVEGPSGTNFIEREILIKALNNSILKEQKAIKEQLVRIDFKNGDVDHYLQHLAQALAI